MKTSSRENGLSQWKTYLGETPLDRNPARWRQAFGLVLSIKNSWRFDDAERHKDMRSFDWQEVFSYWSLIVVVYLAAPTTGNRSADAMVVRSTPFSEAK